MSRLVTQALQDFVNRHRADGPLVLVTPSMLEAAQKVHPGLGDDEARQIYSAMYTTYLNAGIIVEDTEEDEDGCE